MMWSRRSSVVGLALVLALGVSCTSSDSTLTQPSGAPFDQPSLLSGESNGWRENSGSGENRGSGKNRDKDEDRNDGLRKTADRLASGTPKASDLLTCQAQPYVLAQTTVGPEGGSLTVGRHKLEIPRGALTSRVQLTGEQVSGSVNSVRFSPEGLRFAKPARLTLSYRNCASVRPTKRVAYTNELLKILELPLSEDYPKYEYVTGAIDHFSRYAVAY